MIKLQHIQHVLALADERHFARAAKRVHLSQPAFSRSIQAIEARAGLQLFERSSGTARPTPAGEFLIARARQLLFDARTLERDIQFFSRGQLGDAAIGVGPFPAATLLPQVSALLRSEFAGVQLRVEVNNWRQLLDRLLAEELEFFVAHTREAGLPGSVEVQPLMRQRTGFFVRADHPIQAPTTLAALWQFGVATAAFPQAEKNQIAHILALPPDLPVPIALECDDIATLHAVALRTDTVTITTDQAAQVHVAAGLLRRLQVSDFPDVYIDMGLVRLRKRALSPTASHVAQLFAQVAQALEPGTNHGEISP